MPRSLPLSSAFLQGLVWVLHEVAWSILSWCCIGWGLSLHLNPGFPPWTWRSHIYSSIHFLPSLPRIRQLPLCRFISGSSFLLHWSTHLSLCQYHAGSFTVVLSYNLKSGIKCCAHRIALCVHRIALCVHRIALCAKDCCVCTGLLCMCKGFLCVCTGLLCVCTGLLCGLFSIVCVFIWILSLDFCCCFVFLVPWSRSLEFWWRLHWN